MDVTYRNATAQCDLTVPNDKATGMEIEAKHRGLIVYNLIDDDGRYLPGFSIDMPRPGESREQCVERIRAEFGCRVKFASDERKRNTSAAIDEFDEE